jgi:hypothetical protein
MKPFFIALIAFVSAHSVLASPLEVGLVGRVLMSVAVGYWYAPESETSLAAAAFAGPVLEQPIQPGAMPLEMQWLIIEADENLRREGQAMEVYRYLLQLLQRHQRQLIYRHWVQLGEFFDRFRSWRRGQVAHPPRFDAFEIAPALWTRQEHRWAALVRFQRDTRGRVEEVTESDKTAEK